MVKHGVGRYVSSVNEQRPLVDCKINFSVCNNILERVSVWSKKRKSKKWQSTASVVYCVASKHNLFGDREKPDNSLRSKYLEIMKNWKQF
ncbi:hypothetical protein TNCV_2455781 [Trichonephila clavipes]|nr:hypothetical protein TNCV_2455781 [Trichonephila clavipes]